MGGMVAPESPAWAQFGPQQVQFKNSVTALNGTIDIHGVASGTVAGPAGGTATYTSDQHVSGTLKLNQYDSLTGALTGTLDGTVTISEKSVVNFVCTITSTLTASTSAASDFRGAPLIFNFSFDIGSDTWSLWPSNNSVNGSDASRQDCGGGATTSSSTVPMRFMPIDMAMGFPFAATGFDLAGTRTVVCSSCGNANSNPVTYTFTYDLKATTKDCNYALSQGSVTLAANATSGSVSITAGTGCGWAALPHDPWITITSGGSGSGNGTVSFSVAPNPTGAPRTGSINVAGLTFLIVQPGSCSLSAPVITSINSLADFGGFPYFASGSWLEIKGLNLATGKRLWTSSDFQGSNAPTSLDGTKATVNGNPGFVEYISPEQVNVQAPADAAVGPVGISITTCAATSALFPLEKVDLAPGILAPASFNVGGKQYAAALFSDNNTYVGTPGLIAGAAFVPAKPGDYITTYGIGFGDVTPPSAPGVVASGANSIDGLIVLLGDAPAQVYYGGLSPGFVGLYQFVFIVPDVPDGDAQLHVKVRGSEPAQTLYLTVKR